VVLLGLSASGLQRSAGPLGATTASSIFCTLIYVFYRTDSARPWQARSAAPSSRSISVHTLRDQTGYDLSHALDRLFLVGPIRDIFSFANSKRRGKVIGVSLFYLPSFPVYSHESSQNKNILNTKHHSFKKQHI
jgi:hypothetical protein